MNKNTKAKRGRPVKNVNFNFGGRPFTIDNVLARMNRGGKTNISRAAVYNKLTALVNSRKAKVVEHVPGKSKGHPTYKYQLRQSKQKVATAE